MNKSRLSIARNLAISFAITAGYVLARARYYHRIPAADGFAWVIRDHFMTIPRSMGFAAALTFGLAVWGRRRLGVHRRGFLLALMAGTAIAAMDTYISLAGGRAFRLAEHLPMYLFSCLIVGCFEETLFRGVWFNALRDWKGDFYAIWISSALFAAHHIQAQPLLAWPSIFVFGWICAKLRASGVSLIWLIIIHAVVDAVPAIVGSTIGIEHVPYYFAGMLCLATVVKAVVRVRRVS